jgi:putative FmdB family regulatory protein
MPTYTYRCSVHGEFDIEHSIKEKLQDCPKCQSEGLKPQKVIRLISGGTQFVLNGSGWAKDNYS